jgi:hypothetical protein
MTHLPGVNFVKNLSVRFSSKKYSFNSNGFECESKTRQSYGAVTTVTRGFKVTACCEFTGVR